MCVSERLKEKGYREISRVLIIVINSVLALLFLGLDVDAAQIMNNLDVDRSWTEKEDWQIKADIESELWWSPFVDSDEITVSVNDKEQHLIFSSLSFLLSQLIMMRTLSQQLGTTFGASLLLTGHAL